MPRSATAVARSLKLDAAAPLIRVGEDAAVASFA